MTNTEIISTITSIFEGAAICRQGKSNFIAIPTGNPDQPYVKVSVANALAKDTKSHTAFNFDAAQREYELYVREQEVAAAERANKPKAVKGPNPEAQARRDALDTAIRALPPFANKTATEVMAMLPEDAKPKVVMPVGSALKRLVETGEVTVANSEDKADKKPYYTKA